MYTKSRLIPAKELQHKEGLSLVPDDRPGYYKWWARKDELDKILKSLDVSFEKLKNHLETTDYFGNKFYCIYIGIAAKESLRRRLNWHANDKHSTSKIKYGTLSTLRQSISSIVFKSQRKEEETNEFISNLYVEFFAYESLIKAPETVTELRDKEKQLMADNLYILNIQDNNHEKATDIKKRFTKLRKDARGKALNQ